MMSGTGITAGTGALKKGALLYLVDTHVTELFHIVTNRIIMEDTPIIIRMDYFTIC